MEAYPANRENTAHFPILRTYLDSANDAIFVIDDKMRLLLSNTAMASWYDRSIRAANSTHDITTLLIGVAESVELFALQHQMALTGTPVRFECKIRPKGGLPHWVEISMNRVQPSGETVEIIGIVRDINAHKSRIAQLKYQAVHDELTSLMNRQEFVRRLQSLLPENQGAHHSLLYLDLDQFKLINDTCGHLAGDKLLSQVATVIKGKMRATDLLARIGGDEFGILLTHCSLNESLDKAKTILDAIASFRFTWESKHFDISASIGIASITPESDGTECVLGAADSACHVAKEKGRNRLQVFSGSAECTFRRREMDWVSRITQAFEANRFRLHYQHILPVTSGYACFDHHEILLRMIDDNGDLIAPTEFIAAAEKYNLMPLIDRWVIRTLFARKASLMAGTQKSADADHCGSLCSINLSGASLNDDYFLEFLRDQIAFHDIRPHLFCFEITETVAINNLGRVSELLQELRSMGFKFALDDFGSGMSSFAYLKSLPVDYLKIDGSIVMGIADNQTDFNMVKAIHQIARAMGIRTVAEFVKDPHILEKLHDIGVDFAQGYEIHHPEWLH